MALPPSRCGTDPRGAVALQKVLHDGTDMGLVSSRREVLVRLGAGRMIGRMLLRMQLRVVVGCTGRRTSVKSQAQEDASGGIGDPRV